MADFKGLKKGNTYYNAIDSTARNSISGIEGKIPSNASASNKMATASDIPAAQIQSDWNQTNTSAKDFIKNKPAIPNVDKYYSTDDTAETALADDDYFPFYDTSASGKRKTLWSNIKSKLTTFFNTIYSNVRVYVNSLEIYNQYIGLSSGRQRISIDTGQYAGLHTINGTSYIEQEVTLGTTDTTVIFDSYWVEYTPEGGEITHYYFNDNTIISRLLVGRNGPDIVGGQNQFPYKSMHIANNALTIVFPALSITTNVKVRVYIDNYE